MKWSSFQEMDKEIQINLGNIANGFIKLGYLFKKAKDSELYREEGYATFFEYIEEKYGVERTQATRFMQINTTYSLHGDSIEIDPKYASHGSSKLAEMLSLPGYIREEIPSEITRKEIREIKAEFSKENEVCAGAQTSINTECEQDSESTESWIKKYFKQYREKFKTFFLEVQEALKTDNYEAAKDRFICAIAPSKFSMDRIEGANVMYSNESIKIMPIGKEKITISMIAFVGYFRELYQMDLSPEEAYVLAYNEPWETEKPATEKQELQVEKQESEEHEEDEENEEEAGVETEENEDEENLAEKDPEEELEETVEEIIETPPADEIDVHQPQEELGKVTIISKPVVEEQPAAVLEEGKDLGDLLDDIEYESQTLWKSITNWKAEKLSMKDLTDADEQLQKIRDLLYVLMEEKK